MIVSLKTLMKILPMDEKVREKTLNEMDSYSPDQRRILSRTSWNVFYRLIELETKNEFEKALKSKNSNIEFKKDLYQKIEDQVYKRYMRNIRDQQESEKLEDIRSGLKNLTSQTI